MHAPHKGYLLKDRNKIVEAGIHVGLEFGVITYKRYFGDEAQSHIDLSRIDSLTAAQSLVLAKEFRDNHWLLVNDGKMIRDYVRELNKDKSKEEKI